MQRVRSVPQDERDEQTAGKASKTSCKYLQVPQLFVKIVIHQDHVSTTMLCPIQIQTAITFVAIHVITGKYFC